MHIYNLKKIKKQINIDLQNRIEEHRKDYICKLKIYSENYGAKEMFIKGKKNVIKEEDYNLESNSMTLYTKIENKNISNKDNDKDKYKILSNIKINYDEFINCRFTRVIFRNCSFEGTIFHNCIFTNVIFEECKFVNENSITILEQDCILKNVRFKNCNLRKSIFKRTIFDNTRFIKTNLKDSILSDTQIKSIQISDCDCRSFKIIDSNMEVFEIEDDYITRFDEYTFIDKIIIDKKYLKSYENAYKAYRKISAKFENNNLLDYAGEYYYLSKKAEIKILKGLDKIKSYMFWMLCGYGERPTYALVTSIEIVILFAIFYMFTGLKVDGNEINYSMTIFDGFIYSQSLCRDFFNSLYFSITTFTTVGYGDITPVRLSILLSGIEMFLGVTMVGLWTATLARKIIR